MTQSFATNSNNDLYIGTDGNLVIASGIEAVLFACANAAKAQLNEMIYAYDKGVANFQTIWTSAINVAQFESSVRTAILAVPGVTGISNFDMIVVNNSMNYSATIVTVFGIGEING
jgi:hypothetical protein